MKNALGVRVLSGSAKVKGSGEDARPTAAQDTAYKEALASWLAKEDQARGQALTVAWGRGAVAKRMLQNTAAFGVRDVDIVAMDLGVKRLTLERCIRFNELVSQDQLKELTSRDRRTASGETIPVPTWRMMMQWAGVRDDETRNQLYADIISGVIVAGTFDDTLRKLTSRPKKKTRQPADGVATVRRLTAEVATLSEHLEWLTRAKTAIGGLDGPARRAAQQSVKEFLDGVRATVKALNKAMKDCESLL